MKKSGVITIVMLSGYVIFLIVSLVLGFDPGKEIGLNFASFSLSMLKILPGAFILIGLFEVWVKRATVARHLGKESGGWGYLWGILLASTTVGGLYVAFPVAYSLYSKGAKLSVIFTYVGAAAICRIPMSIFEASFLGIEFTIVRLLVSVPLVILTAMLLGNYLTKRNYSMTDAGKS